MPRPQASATPIVHCSTAASIGSPAGACQTSDATPASAAAARKRASAADCASLALRSRSSTTSLGSTAEVNGVRDPAETRYAPISSAW